MQNGYVQGNLQEECPPNGEGKSTMEDQMAKVLEFMKGTKEGIDEMKHEMRQRNEERKRKVEEEERRFEAIERQLTQMISERNTFYNMENLDEENEEKLEVEECSGDNKTSSVEQFLKAKEEKKEVSLVEEECVEGKDVENKSKWRRKKEIVPKEAKRVEKFECDYWGIPITPYPIPFPQRCVKEEKREEFETYIALKKKKMEESKVKDEEVKSMHEEYSMKVEDLGNDVMPCEIEGKRTLNARCDLERSENVMPYSTYRSLDMGELKPTTSCLKGKNGSFILPFGKVEDVVVKVNEMVFSVDFMVLGVEAEPRVPLTLGKNFFTTERSSEDEEKEEVSLSSEDENELLSCHQGGKD